MIEVPLTSEPEQRFSIKIDDQTYNCTVTLNSRLGIWSISLSQNNVDLVLGVALLSGVDIFGQYNIGISNAYVVNLSNSIIDPQKDNLGTVAKLFILTDDEVIVGG